MSDITVDHAVAAPSHIAGNRRAAEACPLPLPPWTHGEVGEARLGAHGRSARDRAATWHTIELSTTDLTWPGFATRAAIF